MWVDEDFFDLDKHTKQIGVDPAYGNDKSVQAIAARQYLEGAYGEPVVIALPPPPEDIDWEDYKENALNSIASAFAIPFPVFLPRLGDTALTECEKREMYKQLADDIRSGKIVLTRDW